MDFANVREIKGNRLSEILRIVREPLPMAYLHFVSDRDALENRIDSSTYDILQPDLPTNNCAMIFPRLAVW